MQTFAAVATGGEVPFAVETIDIVDPRPDEILVRVEAVGLCHTDLVTKAFWPAVKPIVLGHEGAGVVEQVGQDITDVSPGDKVLLSYASCGVCAACISGYRGYCAQFAVLNASGARGDGSATLSRHGEPIAGSFFGQSSFARHAVARRANAVVVDPATDLSVAAPMGCGFQTGAGAVINVLAPEPESAFVVYGAGGVGMAAIMAAAALGVKTIVVVDLSPVRREVALTVGATAALDGGAEDLLTQIRKVTGGGASHAFDTTGVGPVISTAAKALRPLGTLVVVGLGAPEITIDVTDLIAGGKSVRGCIEGDADPQRLLPQLLRWHSEGRFPVERIIQTFPFEDINEAVAAAVAGTAIKPVLTFPG